MILILTCYALLLLLQDTLHNPIEHLWSPISKRLASVRFSAICNGDSRPPCQIGKISAKAKRDKEAEVFDNAISELCSVHWKDVSFDGSKVQPCGINCLNHIPSPYNDHSEVACFLKAGIRDLQSGKYTSYQE